MKQDSLRSHFISLSQ